MAQQYVSEDATFTVPGAYPSIKVQRQNSGLATTGVLFLIGEAEAGPDYSLEADLTQNFYGPDEAAQVVSKYGSGPVVDAYRAASQPANDPDITGSPSALYIIKTNVSTKASKAMARAGLADYGILAHKGYGKQGNMIYATVSALTEEVAPTTGLTTYIPGPELGASDGSILGLRVNGGAAQTLTISSRTLPSDVVSGLNGKTGILATGGVDRDVLTGLGASGSLALAFSGAVATITLSGASAWNVTPSAGDTLIIPQASTYGKSSTPSVIEGTSSANCGAYVVTASTTTTITATKLKDDVTTGVSGLSTVSATPLATDDEKDLMCFSPINITNVTGVDRGMLAGLIGMTITAGTAPGGNSKFTLQTGSAWAAMPQAGDLLHVPASGWYEVVSATTGVAAGASTIVATFLSNGAGLTAGTVTVSALTDYQLIRPVIDGFSKSVELYDAAGVLNVSTLFYTTAGAAVSWLSTASVPYLLTSASEYIAQLDLTRQNDNISEEVFAGGSVLLKVGYAGTTGSMTITSTMLTTTVVGGNGGDLSLTLADFKTVSDLAFFISAQAGYSCTVGTTLLGQQALVVGGTSVLDRGTFGIASSLGATPGRVKRDAFDFFRNLSTGSVLAQLGTGTPTQASSGLPEVQSRFYLGGATRGGTSGAQVSAAIDSLQKLKGNFVITCFSRDAADDIASGLTDASSTYVIDDINAAVKTHVLKMSTVKRRRNRQGFVSKKTSFTAAKEAANNLACFRVALVPQDYKTVASDSTIKQFAGFIGAALAAGMQAAGFYRSIMHKGINCSGVLMADGSYADSDIDQPEEALKNGLLVSERVDTGGFRWVSDQTTYAADSNFVYNSIQAIYVADIVALTTAQRMEKAFVGQSLADVSAAVALVFLKSVMADLKRLKLLASSDDAPLGFKSASVKISGNAMIVSLEIKLATAIAFIPIAFLVSEVQQVAA